MIQNFFSCLFSFIFILLLSIPLFYWLRYVLRNSFKMPLPNFLAHISMIGILFYGLWITLQMLFRGCREGFPTPPSCNMVVQIFDRIQNTNKLSDPHDDTWSFQMIVQGDKVTKNGWAATVQGKTVKGQYGLPVRVKGLKNFSSTTFTITDTGNPECNRPMTVEPPSVFTPTPPSPGAGGGYCKDLKNCFAADGFSVGQLTNRHILIYYDAPTDWRRQRKLFLQYYTKKGWLDAPEEKTVCNGVEANIFKSSVIADSLRTTYYPKDSAQTAFLTLATFPVQNGQLICRKIKTRIIKDDDPMLK